MKGTITDFLKLASENPNLGRELGELAAKYDFEFIRPEELSEDDLEGLAGGTTLTTGELSTAFIWTPPPLPLDTGAIGKVVGVHRPPGESLSVDD